MGPLCKAGKKTGAIFPEPEEEEEEETGAVLDKAITFFDGSRVSPIEEASLVLERTSSDEEARILQEELQEEEEVITWLTAEFSYSSTSDINASFSCSNNIYSPYRIWDIVNLDVEDSSWISDTESELESFQSDFPSPSYKSGSSNSSVPSLAKLKHEKSQYVSSSGSDNVSDEAVDLEDLSSDEPLFWPSDGKSDWGLEVAWGFFIMSPRKNIHKLGISNGPSPESIGLRVHSRKMDLAKECRRKLVFGSGSKSSKVLELKCASGNKEVIRRINTKPSRLSKSTNISMKIVPLNTEDDIVDEEKDFTKKSVGKNLLEDDFASSDELEILLGLDEFDGHEGVELEFNKDDFSLDESLRKSNLEDFA